MDPGRQIKLRGGGEGDEYDLATAMGALKERGCSILVAGRMPIATSRTVSRRLFGHPEERRERVLLRLRPTTFLDEWFPRGVGLDDRGVRIVDYTAPGRSAAGDSSDFDRVRWNSKFDPSETPGLSRRANIGGCVDEIDAVVGEAGRLEPSQLRVGVYSLDVLDGPSEMIDVVSRVSSTITTHRGMVHYHLQRPPRSEAARGLLDHVDAMLTVRKDVPNEPALQKWTVPDYGESSWIPLRRFE